MEPFDGPAPLKVYKDCEAEAGKQDKVNCLASSNTLGVKYM